MRGCGLREEAPRWAHPLDEPASGAARTGGWRLSVEGWVSVWVSVGRGAAERRLPFYHERNSPLLNTSHV